MIEDSEALLDSEINFLNSNILCICCFKKPEERDNHIAVNGKFKKIIIPLVKHHVKYFPQVIAYVHDHCHNDINEGKYPHLVQYEEGDSREFYGDAKIE